MTRKKAQWLFHYYNHKYFGGKLPKYKVVFAKDLLPRNLIAECNNRRRIIRIATDIKKLACVVRATLLHEMVHAKQGYKDRRGDKVWHGPQFQKEMLKLAKMGAFKGTW